MKAWVAILICVVYVVDHFGLHVINGCMGLGFSEVGKEMHFNWLLCLGWAMCCMCGTAVVKTF